MNLFLQAAPNAEIIHGSLANVLSLTDMCDRQPVSAPDGPLDIGGHKMRFIATPHVPHNWEAGLWFDEAISTLLAGDLFTQAGRCQTLSESDCVAPALNVEELFHSTGLTTNLVPTLRHLAELNPATLALMHGPSYTGDGAGKLLALADDYAAMRT